MADIFISYAREDREWVEKLANALVAEGFTVWWDWDLLVGKRYRETIETELQSAKSAIVVWSQHSVRSDFVRDEAEDAQQRNILLPLLKETVRPPAGFRQLQTADLTSWTGATSHAEFRRMMRGVSHLVGRPANGGTEDHPGEAEAPIPVPTAEPMPERVPEPVVMARAPAPAPPPPVQATVVASAPVHAPVIVPAPPSPFAGLPPSNHPVWRYIAIGAVVLVAIIYGVVQLRTPHAPANAGGTTAATPAPSGTPAGSGGAADSGNEGQHGTGTGGATTGGATAPVGATDMASLSADVATVVTKAEKADSDARARAALALDQQKLAEAAAARANAGGDATVGVLSGHDAAGDTFSFAGEVADGLEQGVGTAVLTNGAHYAGQWFGGVSQGLGAFSYANGDLYAGEFDQNMEYGLGVLTFALKTNGLGYSGQWSANGYNGYGVYYYANGGRFEGLWKNGQLNGLGAKIDPTGKVVEQGTYENSTLRQ